MLRYNGIGSLGYGSGAGRGLGHCGAGMAYGRRGGGRDQKDLDGEFWGYRSYQPQITKEEEKERLAQEVTNLQEELKVIKVRLTELKGQK